MLKAGTVYWITGLSGAGKTTIGKLFCSKLKSQGCQVIFLDGDSMREVLGSKGYSLEDRKKLGLMYGKLCKLISDQSFDVVCTTISMFNECWTWNRNNIPNYKEIYLKVSKELLLKRDVKGIYKKEESVVGKDLQVKEPTSPDLIINGDEEKTAEEVSDEMFSFFFNSQVGVK